MENVNEKIIDWIIDKSNLDGVLFCVMIRQLKL